MRGKKRKDTEIKKQQEIVTPVLSTSDGSVQNVGPTSGKEKASKVECPETGNVSCQLISIEEQQQSLYNITGLEEKEVGRDMKRKLSDKEEEIDKCLKLSKTDKPENKAGHDFHTETEEKRKTNETITGRNQENYFVATENKNSEPIGGNSCIKNSVGQNVLSELEIGMTSDKVQSDTNECVLAAFVKDDTTSVVCGDEIKIKDTGSTLDHIKNMPNTLEDEQPVIGHDVTKESLGGLPTDSKNKEKVENEKPWTVLTETPKNHYSDKTENLIVEGQSEADFEQSELAKSNEVQEDTHLNELFSINLRNINTTSRDEVEDKERVKKNGTFEMADSLANEENKENLIYLKIVSSESIATINHTEIYSTETYHLDSDKIFIADSETGKVLDNGMYETETAVVDTEGEKRTGIIANNSDEIETVNNEVDEADHGSDMKISHSQDCAVEDIYLQSTDPVNIENNSVYDHQENVDPDQVGQVLEAEYKAVPASKTSYTDVAREEIVFLSPKAADEAPEMTADITDDLTDSQLCAMDWSSQFPQESGISQQLPKRSLKPEGARSAAKLPPTKSKPEDGTSVVKGLIHELAQLNKSILKTKRELEYTRHKRQQTCSLNRR